MSQKKYRLSIIEDVKQKYAVASALPSGSKKRLRGNDDIDEAYPDRNKNVGYHMPIFSEKRGNCKYCYHLVTNKRLQGAENRTNIKCLCCEVYLCLNKNRNCFIEFHK